MKLDNKDNEVSEQMKKLFFHVIIEIGTKQSPDLNCRE